MTQLDHLVSKIQKIDNAQRDPLKASLIRIRRDLRARTMRKKVMILLVVTMTIECILVPNEQELRRVFSNHHLL